MAVRYGLVPSRLLSGDNPWSIMTHMFVHAEIFHLFFNMLALMWLGSSLEPRIGKAGFLAVYIACGMMAGIGFGIFNAAVNVPAVGASAAIFGLMGTLSLLYPTSFVVILVIPVPIMLISTVYAIVTVVTIQSGNTGPVGHLAHLIGMASGMLLAFLMEPQDALKGMVIFIMCFIGIVIAIQII